MEKSSKRKVFNRAISLSAACLLAFLAQTQVSADSQVTTEASANSSGVENTTVTPETPLSVQSEETKASSQVQVQEKEQMPSTEEPPAKVQPAALESPVESAQKTTVEPSLKEAEPTAPSEESTQVSADAVKSANSVSSSKTVELKESTVYMSEKATITDTVSVGDADTSKIAWTLDGKSVDEWKTWVLKKGDFVGDPFITINSQKVGDDLNVTISLNELFGSDLSRRTPSNIRRTYRHYMGIHQLVGTNEDGTLVLTKSLNFRPYASFRTHDEMLAEIEETKKNAASDRLVTIENIGTSEEKRDIKMAVIAKNQESIDRYLNVTTPMMLNHPDQLLKLLQNNNLDYKLPILINNTHADEQPGIDIITSLFKDFATKNTITYRTTDKDGNAVTATLNIPKLLERFIFLFDFTENPDGDVNNTRTLADGLDPNRDAGYQVHPETQAIVKQINKWNPIALLDIHGFVKDFLIEPATPPHDPNFEYDLFADFALENAKQMGRAGVANSKYDHYIIPKLDYGSGWDDAFSGYTGVYALYHGILGHTIEIPEANEESFKAGFYAVLGSVNYLSSIPKELMAMRLNFYSRGINKVESPNAEKELVGPNGEVVGRPKGNHDKFFPDYYVIPMTLEKENNSQQAFNMIEYFKRNGVIVKELTQDVDHFKKGDLVIDMAQAKRGFTNHILYSGSNESKWEAMYAELVVNFPAMRGFKATAVFNKDVFANKLSDVSHSSAPRTTSVDYKAPYYVIANNSESAVMAVNQAIRNGSKVYLTDDGYVVDTATFVSLLPHYAIYGEALYKQPVGQTLKLKKIYSPSHSYSWAGFNTPTDASLALQGMGFDVVDSVEQADIVVLASKQFDASILGKKPTVVLGGEAMQRLEELGVLPGFDAEQLQNGDDYEGLMKAIVNDKHPLASGYATNDLFYSNSGNWIQGVPTGFTKLMSVAGSDFYIAGWWPGYEGLADKVVAVTGEFKNQPLFIYAGNPTNRLHSVHFYRWVSNAVFGVQLATLNDLPSSEPEVPNSTPQTSSAVTLSVNYHTKAFKQKTLPQTGTNEQVTPMVVGALLLLAGSVLLKLKREENE